MVTVVFCIAEAAVNKSAMIIANLERLFGSQRAELINLFRVTTSKILFKIVLELTLRNTPLLKL